MSIKVIPKPGEKIQFTMKRFKKICEREGLVREMRRLEAYEKPSDKRRRARMRTVKNRQRLLAEEPQCKNTQF
jgi:small subunit ribosomal protein S21